MSNFDQKEYIKDYIKENYKQIAFRYKANTIEYIKAFAKARSLSIPIAITKAFKYIDMHNIDISDIDIKWSCSASIPICIVGFNS